MVNPAAAAAIGFGFSAVGWLISPVLSRFLNRCFDELDIDVPPGFQSQKQILLAKLEKLQTILLPQLLILTDAAHQSPHRLFLEKWIQKLKSAFYQAEHLLGLVEYERLEEKVNKLYPSFTSTDYFLAQTNEKIQKLHPQKDYALIEQLKSLKTNLEESRKRSAERDSLIKSIEKLEEIVNEGMEFVNKYNIPSSSVNSSTWNGNKQYRETISTPDSTVIGRDKDREHILKLLEQDSPESINPYSVIAIWGMGGLGKTTLAQFVCEDVKEKKSFDHVMWVHVSENFNIHSIVKKMWESVTRKTCPGYENFDVLISELCNNLKDKKYLLVLDDVWCNKGVSQRELDQLFVPLKYGNPGSKILVTTRNEDAARALGARDPIKLRELDDEEFLSLFMTCALPDGEVDKDVSERLRKIGMEIVKKLYRSPLAAVTVGGQLRRRLDPDFWEIMSNKTLLNDAMGSLYLSYQNLDPPLQRCFAFCSLFPKGHSFDPNKMINLWIAEGFIETENKNELMKDIGNEYIKELTSCSFFQVKKKYEYDCYIPHAHSFFEGSRLMPTAAYSYYMHDLIHDLAQHVSEGECFRIESGEKNEIRTQTRHLYVDEDMLGEYMEKICKIKDIHTIISFRNIGAKECSNELDLEALFTNLRKLRVVDLQEISLPKSVIQLKNLRYLEIDKAVAILDSVIESLNRLYQLRILSIRSRNPFSAIEIPDVGRLTLLQDLREFDVKKKRGLELKQLGNLADLSGSLSIYGLHNVERKEEAHEVKLYEKTGLQNLHFCWYDSKDFMRSWVLDLPNFESNDVPRDLDVEVLEGLCPPPQIKELRIEGYGGKRIPNWMLDTDGDIMIHLKSLRLTSCVFLEALPRIDKLPHLLTLTISLLPRLKSWVPPPVKLTKLIISRCFSLDFARKEDLEMIASVKSLEIPQIVNFLNNSKMICYNLTSVNYAHKILKLVDHKDEQSLSTTSSDLKGCLEKLIDLISQLKLECIYDKLYLPPTLEELCIESCFITDRVLAESLQGPIHSLTRLELKDIITITCITDEVLSSLTSLRALHVIQCLLLSSIGGWDTHNNLEYLDIYCCPKLTLKASAVANCCDIVEQTSSSCKRKTTSCILKDVDLWTCSPLDDSFQNLVTLKTLRVEDCPTIVNAHIGNLKSLIRLSLWHCPNLISLRGLSELDHLKELWIRWCQKLTCYSDADKLPRLEMLTLDRFWQLKQLISRDGFSSLVSLTLWDAEEEYFSQEECEVLCCLSSLETIHFSCCKVRTLPSLLGLHALKSVEIRDCKNLTSLSELSPSVTKISIKACNKDFTRSCKDPKSPNWQKMSHIPEKHI